MLLWCAACESWSVEDDCWLCGGPMVHVSRSPWPWAGSHRWAPEIEFCSMSGVPTECGPLIDNLI